MSLVTWKFAFQNNRKALNYSTKFYTNGSSPHHQLPNLGLQNDPYAQNHNTWQNPIRENTASAVNSRISTRRDSKSEKVGKAAKALIKAVSDDMEKQKSASWLVEAKTQLQSLRLGIRFSRESHSSETQLGNLGSHSSIKTLIASASVGHRFCSNHLSHGGR